MTPTRNSPASTAGKMTFHLRGNGGNYIGAEWVAAEGEIVSGTAEDLGAFMKRSGYSENPGGWNVRLNSPGGSLSDGIRLGELIRELKLGTEVGASVPDEYRHWRRVPGYCASAAAFAFLGGLSRDVSNGELGVHQFYDAISLRNPSAKIFDSLDMSGHQFISAMLIDYAFRMGVDPRFVSLAASTPPMEMRYLDDKSLDDLKVRWSPEKFEPWSIEPSGNGVIAITKSKDKTRTAKFFCLADGIPRISVQIKQSDCGNPNWLQDAIENVTSVVAFDLTFPRNALELRYIDGDPVLEYALPGVNGKTISSAKWAGVGVDGPRYIWSAFTYEMPRENAEAAIRVALKNGL